MKISHSEDYITDVVIGGGKVEEFEIADTANFFIMLSDSLYSEKEYAVARETLCNAWDSHIDSGVTSTPLDIRLTATMLTIRDYGAGIAPDMMKPLYCTYGGSNKVSNIALTGGFGLGCKSPFAIASNFTVTSYHDGIMSVYNLSKKSGDVAGKPSIKTLLSTPTTETGLKVEIPIPEGYQSKFRELILNVVRRGSMNANFEGSPVGGVWPSQEKTNGFILSLNSTAYKINIRYGNVVYPLPECDEYENKLSLLRVIHKALTNNYTSVYYNYGLTLEIAPDMLSVTPSRESISLTPQSIKSISNAIDNFITNFKKQRFNLDQIIKNNYLKSSNLDDGIKDNLLRLMGKNYNYYNNNRSITKIETSMYNLFANSILVPDVLDKIETMFPNILKEINNKKTKLIFNSKLVDTKLFKSFKNANRLTNSYPEYKKRDALNNILIKNIIAPLILKINDNKDLDKRCRLYLFNYHEFVNYKKLIKKGELSYLLYATQKVAFLGNNLSYINENYSEAIYKYLSHIKVDGSIAVTVPQKASAVKAIKALLKEQGYFVIDLTLDPIKKSKVMGPPKPVKKRPKGYPLLSNLLHGSTYIETLRMWDTELPHTTKPEFVVYYANRKSQTHLGPFDGSETRIICDMFGHKGAICSTKNKYDKAIKNGALPITEWLDNEISSIIKNDYTLQYAIKKRESPTSRRYENTDDLVDTILTSPITSRRYVSKTPQIYISETHSKFADFIYYIVRYTTPNLTFPKTIEITNKLKGKFKNKKRDILKQEIDNSEYIHYLNIHKIEYLIESTNISFHERQNIKQIYTLLDLILGIKHD